MIIYIHGFASSGEGTKYQILKEAFPEHTVLSPTLPAPPLQAVELLETALRDTEEKIAVVGTSLGGFYALYLAAKLYIPAFIINPSLIPWKTLKPLVGMNKRFDTDEDFEWKESYLDELLEMGKLIETSNFSHKLLNFYLSTDDELLNHSGLKEIFPVANKVLYYDHSAHRFTRFPELIPDFRATLENNG